MAYRYLTIKVSGKTKLLHRHLMEQHIGRPLGRDEHVHHRDGNIRNNALVNLALLTAQEHMRLHKTKYPEQKVCAVCGAIFTPTPTKRARARTCSKTCAYNARWMTRRGEWDRAERVA